jgi:hypothetical protein
MGNPAQSSQTTKYLRLQPNDPPNYELDTKYFKITAPDTPTVMSDAVYLFLADVPPSNKQGEGQDASVELPVSETNLPAIPSYRRMSLEESKHIITIGNGTFPTLQKTLIERGQQLIHRLYRV